MILSAIFGASTTNLIVLFVIVFVCAFGIPGGLLWLVASGAAANSISELVIVMAVGTSAAILGDFSAFMLARKFSLQIQKFLRRFKFYSKNEDTVKAKFRKSEFSIIFFSRFLFQELCAVTTYASGFLRLKKRKFLVADISGELVYGTAFPILGFLFKETWTDYTTIVSDVTAIILLAVVAYFLGRWAIKYYHRVRRNRLAK